MTHTRRAWALPALALTLVLAACSTPEDLNREQPSAALITDADIDRASLEVARTEVVVKGVEEGSVPDGAQTNLPDSGSQLSSQAVLPDVGGYIAHVRVVRGTSTTWQIWLSNQSNDQKTLVYEGGLSISSAAVNLAGDTLYFVAQAAAGSSNSEVYRHTRSNGSTTSLTSTSSAEADVSVSASGQTVVWSGINASTGKRAVYVRDYSGSTFSQRVLSLSTANQLSPTVSGDGAYVAFIRQGTSTQVIRFRKSDSTYLTVSTPSTSVSVRGPSVSNGGLKVAWGEDTKSTQASAMKVKTISSGSIVTAGSSSSRIYHPHLTSDGAYMTYAVTYGGAFNVSTKNLSSGQIARLTSDTSSSITNTEAFWQKGPRSTPPISIQGTVSSGSSIRVKLFQANTGAIVSETRADSGGFYSFNNIAAMTYYVAAYEDEDGNGAQSSSERAGAFGRAAIPQQVNAVSGTYTANVPLTTPAEIESNDDLNTDNVLLQTTYVNAYLEATVDYDPETGEEIYATEYDYFKLLVPTAGTYTLTTTGSCSYTDENGLYTPDTYLDLYNSSGNHLSADDDGSGNGYCSRITYNFTQAGSYFVSVRGLGGRSGNYTLTFQR